MSKRRRGGDRRGGRRKSPGGGVGLVLYLLLVTLVLLRWLTVPMTPAALGRPYWILMRATAIGLVEGSPKALVSFR